MSAAAIWGEELKAAVLAADLPAARSLLAATPNGADLNATAAARGESLLTAAARAGHLELTEMLLAAGSDPAARDRHGATAESLYGGGASGLTVPAEAAERGRRLFESLGEGRLFVREFRLNFYWSVPHGKEERMSRAERVMDDIEEEFRSHGLPEPRWDDGWPPRIWLTEAERETAKRALGRALSRGSDDTLKRVAAEPYVRE